MSKILSLNVGGLIPVCDSHSPLCVSGTISKLQQFQDLPCAMAKEICLTETRSFQDVSAVGVAVYDGMVYAVTYPSMVKITKTKYRVKKGEI